MMLRYVLSLGILFSGVCVADIDVDLSQQDIRLTFNVAETTRITFLNPKAYHRYGCDILSTNERPFHVSAVPPISLDVLSRGEGDKHYYLSLEASPHRRAHQQYRIELSHQAQGDVAVRIYCTQVALPKGMVDSRERKDTELNGLTDVMNALTALVEGLRSKHEVDNQEELNHYVQQIHRFDAYRDEPEVKALYAQVWDMLNEKASTHILLNKAKVSVPSAKDDGTTIQATPIENVIELQLLNRETLLSGNYIMGQMMPDGSLRPMDMDVSCTRYWNDGRGFTPIAEGAYRGTTSCRKFSGQFMGNRCAIWELYVNRTGKNDSASGLFSYTTMASICDLKVDARILGGWVHNGGLVGVVGNHTTIQNCHASSRSSGAGSSYNGGLVGEAQGHTAIQNCLASGCCVGDWGSRNGSLVGIAYPESGPGNITIQSSYAIDGQAGSLIGSRINPQGVDVSDSRPLTIEESAQITSYPGWEFGPSGTIMQKPAVLNLQNF